MKLYFLIQFKMLNRHLAAFGIHPVIGCVLILAAFTGSSVLIFEKTAFAEYLYLAASLSFLARLSDPARNQFLRSCFGKKDYRVVRMLENVIVAAPFAAFLVIEKYYFHALAALFLAGFMSLTIVGNRSGFTIPTPFGKRPFEFTVGFRNSFPVIVLAWFLTVMAVISGNFNLGIASLILVFLVCFSYYLNPENEFYVWIFNSRPGIFLFGKIKTALVYATFLTLPVSLVLSVFYSDKILIIGAFQLLGYIYLGAVVLAKYSSYPHPMNLPQFIILVVSVWFPPLLLAVIPFFYRKSSIRLKTLLA
ncbi:MAG TPA: hypothetical protein PLW31_06225 [Bacteroidales bacterium]|nr:hypothetical protein [Bacteroidales bacterium]HOX77619.1 hypothetical protein [Bacteroidales bacterium]HPI84751.1 hypothetical protein [Bacteroidales bacterium]HPM91215.1 hypothetical protein [Bacteroidales bacterium]